MNAYNNKKKPHQPTNKPQTNHLFLFTGNLISNLSTEFKGWPAPRTQTGPHFSCPIVLLLRDVSGGAV